MPKGRPRQRPPRQSARAKELPAEARATLRRVAEFVLQARQNSGLYVKLIVAGAQKLAPGLGVNTVNAYMSPDALEAQGSCEYLRLRGIVEATGATMLDLERYVADEEIMSPTERAALQILRLLPTPADRDYWLAFGRERVLKAQLGGALPSSSLTQPPPSREEVVRDIRERGKADD